MRNQSTDPAQLLMNVFQAAQEAMRQFSPTPDAGRAPLGPDSMGDAVAAWRQFANLQQTYTRQIFDFWSGLFDAGTAGHSGETEIPVDRRFSSAAWREDPRFDALSRIYLAYSGFLKKVVDGVPADEKIKRQLHFAVAQYVDAISPANFLATNPEVQQLARETDGRSVMLGMSLFFEDLAKGRISMTDERAFQVGRNVGASEGAVVFENELIQLIQYAARTKTVHQRPLLIVPPCINKFYILDLRPENSFVRYAIEQGHTVFLVSWRNITPEMGHLTWDDYLAQGVIQGIDVALAITGADRVNALGFCIGGTLLGSALAVLAARGQHKASSLTLLTTLLDYTDTGDLGLLVSRAGVEAREAAIGKGGVMKGDELGLVFSTLRANDLIWQYVVNSYLKGKRPPAFDMLYWNSDAANVAGPMFCWYLRNTYLENTLRIPGGTTQCGVPVDLSRIDLPVYLYASQQDHIVPWHAAYASTRLLTNEKTFVLGASGHIAGVINAPAAKKRSYWTGGVLGDDPDHWLESATSVRGSWWPNWSSWLAPRAGEMVRARSLLNDTSYPAIEPAPGRYVTAKTA